MSDKHSTWPGAGQLQRAYLTLGLNPPAIIMQLPNREPYIIRSEEEAMSLAMEFCKCMSIFRTATH